LADAKPQHGWHPALGRAVVIFPADPDECRQAAIALLASRLKLIGRRLREKVGFLRSIRRGPARLSDEDPVRSRSDSAKPARACPPLAFPLHCCVDVRSDASHSSHTTHMSTSLSKMPATDPESQLVNVVVDTPKGSRNKYKWDEQNGQWRLSKVLPQGSYFPFDFGFVPSTKAGDGDPIDVLLIADEHTFPGCVVPARLIGVLEAEQTEEGQTVRNDRLVAVVETPHNPPRYHSLEEMDQHVLDEVEHFFTSYNQAEGRDFKPLDRRGPEHANQLLKKAAAGGGKNK
jgi:inorganic pyrophosphatase